MLYQTYSFSLTFSIQYRGDGITENSMEVALSKCAEGFIEQELSQFELNCSSLGGDGPYIVDVDVNLYRYSKSNMMISF